MLDAFGHDMLFTHYYYYFILYCKRIHCVLPTTLKLFQGIVRFYLHRGSELAYQDNLYFLNINSIGYNDVLP